MTQQRLKEMDEKGDFVTLPNEMLQKIGSYMDTKSIVAMSQTSTEFFSFFREDLENLAMQKLNTCILHGEEENAIAIIKSRPSLLLSRGPQLITQGDFSKI